VHRFDLDVVVVRYSLSSFVLLVAFFLGVGFLNIGGIVMWNFLRPGFHA
jgi:hypothetical protein